MAEGFESTRARKPDFGVAKFTKKAAYASVPSEDPDVSSPDEENEAEVVIWDKKADLDEDSVSLLPTPDIDKDGVVREYEAALEHLGFGFFHILLLIVNGIALLSDAIEILAVSFIFPVLIRNQDWNVGSEEQAILSSVIFVGMLFGSYVWGGLADVIGRRPTMILSLTISVLFGLLSAFSPWFWLFVSFRLFSGFGVGGSLPVIFPYSSEFIRNKYRGPYLSCQSIFWMFGRLLCGGFAWLMLSRGDFLWAGLVVRNWRVFLAVSALPALIGAVMYFIFPESPRYMLEVGKQQEALRILKLVYRINHPFTKAEYPVKAILLDVAQSEGLGHSLKQWRVRKVVAQFKEIFSKNMELFQRKYLRQTLLLLVVMFCLSFGSYGVTLWYPTYVSELNSEREAERLWSRCNQTERLSGPVKLSSYCGCSDAEFVGVSVSNQTIKAWNIHNAFFHNVTFSDVIFDSVLFNNTDFKDCRVVRGKLKDVYFNASKLSGLVFLQSVEIEDDSLCVSRDSDGRIVLANATADEEEKQLSQVESSKSKTSRLESDGGCELENPASVQCSFDDFRVYRDSFFVSASGLPGNLASAIAVYYLRRNHWLAMSMLACTLSVFLLYVVTLEAFVVAMLCLFTAVSAPAWNDIGLIIAELYPTSLRTTAAGAHLLMARIGAIIGTNIFGLFVLVNPSVPILLVAVLLGVGSFAAMALPTTTRRTLLK